MLTEHDFKTRIYPELIDAISREEDHVLDSAMAAAEQEAKGYLHRYDIDALFGATGSDRDAALLMKLKDIAAWHFIVLANADVQLELTKTRYDEAVEWLGKIQSGKIYYQNWPVPVSGTSPNENDSWIVASRPKRTTNF
jgi:phage gp36-like protein